MLRPNNVTRYQFKLVNYDRETSLFGNYLTSTCELRNFLNSHHSHFSNPPTTFAIVINQLSHLIPLREVNQTKQNYPDILPQSSHHLDMNTRSQTNPRQATASAGPSQGATDLNDDASSQVESTYLAMTQYDPTNENEPLASFGLGEMAKSYEMGWIQDYEMNQTPPNKQIATVRRIINHFLPKKKFCRQYRGKIGLNDGLHATFPFLNSHREIKLASGWRNVTREQLGMEDASWDYIWWMFNRKLNPDEAAPPTPAAGWKIPEKLSTKAVEPSLTAETEKEQPDTTDDEGREFEQNPEVQKALSILQDQAERCDASIKVTYTKNPARASVTDLKNRAVMRASNNEEEEGDVNEETYPDIDVAHEYDVEERVRDARNTDFPLFYGLAYNQDHVEVPIKKSMEYILKNTSDHLGYQIDRLLDLIRLREEQLFEYSDLWNQILGCKTLEDYAEICGSEHAELTHVHPLKYRSQDSDADWMMRTPDQQYQAIRPVELQRLASANRTVVDDDVPEGRPRKAWHA